MLSGFTVHWFPFCLPFPYIALSCPTPTPVLCGWAPCIISSRNNTLIELCFNHQQSQRSVQERVMGLLTKLGPYPAFRDRLGNKNHLFCADPLRWNPELHLTTREPFSSFPFYTFVKILLLYFVYLFPREIILWVQVSWDQPASLHNQFKFCFSTPHSIQLLLVMLFWVNINSPFLQSHSSL